MLHIDCHEGDCPQLGDIFRNVIIEKISNISNESYDVTTIEFPYAILLSQSCDLLSDYKTRLSVMEGKKDNYNNALLSLLLFPMHNFDLFVKGEHMQHFGWKMNRQERKPSKYSTWGLVKNQDPRYHYFEFDRSTGLVPCVIDFKHWFALESENVQNLFSSGCYVGSLQPLFREQVLQRYANYLSRIGLPDEIEQSADNTATPATC